MSEHFEHPPEKRAARKAAEVLGGQGALAQILGYKDKRNVWPWLQPKGPPFPAELCPLTEAATRRAAAERSDPSLIVTCEELRPDVAWAVLRDPTAAMDTQPATQAAA